MDENQVWKNGPRRAKRVQCIFFDVAKRTLKKTPSGKQFSMLWGAFLGTFEKHAADHFYTWIFSKKVLICPRTRGAHGESGGGFRVMKSLATEIEDSSTSLIKIVARWRRYHKDPGETLVAACEPCSRGVRRLPPRVCRDVVPPQPSTF